MLNKIAPLGDLSYHYTLSYLWVLGAYELIRTLAQCFSNNGNNMSDNSFELLRELKNDFAKLRVPLAKYELKGRKEIKCIPYPAVKIGAGASWQIGIDDIISRRELSDKMLSVFESIDFSEFRVGGNWWNKMSENIVGDILKKAIIAKIIREIYHV